MRHTKPLKVLAKPAGHVPRKNGVPEPTCSPGVQTGADSS
jgi:hypothetical protein